MAKTDIMGLLTGVSSQGIDPMAQLSPAQQRMQFGARRARGLSGAVRGLLGGEAPIREQIAVRMVEKQLQDKAKRKEQIRRVAEALPEEYSALAQGVIDEVQGALPKALEVLGRKTTEDKNQEGEKPSGADIKATKILLSTAGEEAKGKEGGFFGAFSTDWNDAWKKMSDYQQEQVATAVAEATNKLVKLGFDLSIARAMAIKKMYTDNLTKTGLLEFEGESKFQPTAPDIEKLEQDSLENRLSKYSKVP